VVFAPCQEEDNPPKSLKIFALEISPLLCQPDDMVRKVAALSKLVL